MNQESLSALCLAFAHLEKDGAHREEGHAYGTAIDHQYMSTLPASTVMSTVGKIMHTEGCIDRQARWDFCSLVSFWERGN